MKNYTIKIKFISPYLQARFSEEAKEELLKDARQTILKNIKDEDEQWIRLSYFDKNGYYVPSEQIESTLSNAGKDFKMKAKRSSLKEWVKASIFCDTGKYYLNKQQPDEKLVSYPRRKDGNKVRIIHPAFNIGTELEFKLQILDDNFSEDTLKDLLVTAGKRYGLGARRPKFGRFELVNLVKI